MIKHGMICDETTRDDFGSNKPIVYTERNGIKVASEENKDRLEEPVPFNPPKYQGLKQ